MSNIKVLDVINTAENCRKQLIQVNQNKGIGTLSSATLPEAISDYSNSDMSAGQSGHEVRWIDIDGTCVKTYVQDGETAVPPFTPNIDPTYLEFDRWVCTASSLQNVTHRMDCGAYYQVKALEATDPLYLASGSIANTRPTIVKMYIYSESMSVTWYWANTSYSPTVYVDWGDGSAIESFIYSTNLTHTYTQVGDYVIRLVCSAYTWGINLGDPRIYTLYYGNNTSGGKIVQTMISSNMSSCDRLVLSEEVIAGITYNASSLYYFGTFGAQAVIIPYPQSQTWLYLPNQYTEILNYRKSLKYCIIEYGFTTLYPPYYDNCKTELDTLILPDSINRFYRTSPSLYSGIIPYYVRNLYAFTPIQIDDTNTQEATYWHSIISRVDNCNITFKGVITKGLFGDTVFNTGAGILPRRIDFTQVTSITENWAQVNNCIGCVEEILLPQDFDGSLLNIYGNNYSIPSNGLLDSNVIDIAQKLKDNSQTGVVNILRLSSYDKPRFNSIYMSPTGQPVDAGTTGAITLLEYITNKNWTVSFSA